MIGCLAVSDRLFGCVLSASAEGGTDKPHKHAQQRFSHLLSFFLPPVGQHFLLFFSVFQLVVAMFTTQGNVYSEYCGKAQFFII